LVIDSDFIGLFEFGPQRVGDGICIHN